MAHPAQRATAVAVALLQPSQDEAKARMVLPLPHAEANSRLVLSAGIRTKDQTRQRSIPAAAPKLILQAAAEAAAAAAEAAPKLRMTAAAAPLLLKPTAVEAAPMLCWPAAAAPFHSDHRKMKRRIHRKPAADPSEVQESGWVVAEALVQVETVAVARVWLS